MSSDDKLLPHISNNTYSRGPFNFTTDDKEDIIKYGPPAVCAVAIPPIGSTKRKSLKVSKGISMHEFLEETDNVVIKLSAIDELILKNKAALVEKEKQRARTKSNVSQSTDNCKKSETSKRIVSNSGAAATTNVKKYKVALKRAAPVETETKRRPSARNWKIPAIAPLVRADTKSESLETCSVVSGVESEDRPTTPRKGSESSKKAEIDDQSYDTKRKRKNYVCCRGAIKCNQLVNNCKTNAGFIKPTEELTFEATEKYLISDNELRLTMATAFEIHLSERLPATEKENETPLEKRRKCNISKIAVVRPQSATDNPIIGKEQEESINKEALDIIDSNVNVNIFSNNQEVKTIDLQIKNVRSSQVTSLVKDQLVQSNFKPKEMDNHHEEANSLSVSRKVMVVTLSDSEEDEVNLISEIRNMKKGTEDLLKRSDVKFSTGMTKCILETQANHKKEISRVSIFNVPELLSTGEPTDEPKEEETRVNNHSGVMENKGETERNLSLMTAVKGAVVEGAGKQNDNLVSFYSNSNKHGAQEDSPLDTSRLNSSSGSSDNSSTVIESDFDAKQTKTSDASKVPLMNTRHIHNRRRSFKDGTADFTITKLRVLVPEKVSSSVHPDRFCQDECQYCLCKFGLYDTPQHLGQLKTLQKRKAILAYDADLAIDTCLCGSCFRYLIQKGERASSNTRIVKQKSLKKLNKTKCVIQDCIHDAAVAYGNRKSRIIVRRNILKLSFSLRKLDTGEAFGLCHDHYCKCDRYRICGICNNRLTKDNKFSLPKRFSAVKAILRADGIDAAEFVDRNSVLCKRCHHCVSLRLNDSDPSRMSNNNKEYYESFRNKIRRYQKLTNHEDANSANVFSSEERNPQLQASIRVNDTFTDVPCEEGSNPTITDVPIVTSLSRANTPTPIESITNENKQNLDIGQNTQILLEVGLNAIRLSPATRRLRGNLQKPFVDQSSFITHLMIMEKNWREGELVLAKSAAASTIKYVNEMKNHIESFERLSLQMLSPLSTPPAIQSGPSEGVNTLSNINGEKNRIESCDTPSPKPVSPKLSSPSSIYDTLSPPELIPLVPVSSLISPRVQSEPSDSLVETNVKSRSLSPPKLIPQDVVPSSISPRVQPVLKPMDSLVETNVKSCSRPSPCLRLGSSSHPFLEEKTSPVRAMKPSPDIILRKLLPNTLARKLDSKAHLNQEIRISSKAASLLFNTRKQIENDNCVNTGQESFFQLSKSARRSIFAQTRNSETPRHIPEDGQEPSENIMKNPVVETVTLD